MPEIITINKNEKYGTISLSVNFNSNKVISKWNEVSLDWIRSYTTIVSDEVFNLLKWDNWREECNKILDNSLV